MNSTPVKIEYSFIAEFEYDECLGEKQARDFLFSGDPKYREQEQKRFDAWLNDEFYFGFVRIIVKQHNWETGNSVTYKSASVGAIESDCDDAHILQIAYEQAAELQDEFLNMPKFTCEDLKLVRR